MPGEELTRWTVRLTLAAYFAACALLLTKQRGDSHIRTARWCWTVACVFLWIHVVCAFQFFHHWSQAEAMAHTAQETKEAVGFAFEAGFFVNYAVMLLWGGDALWWHINPQSYEHRPRLLNMILHAFLAFVVFNAAVVFETGGTRWFSLAAFAGLAVLGRPTSHRSERRGAEAASAD